MRALLLSALLLLAATASSFAGDTARVLFVGNSYTYYNDLPELVREIAASNGDVLIKTTVATGGATLQSHSTSPATLAQIDTGNWDYVVLQEQSQRPAFPDEQVATEVYPYAEQLSDRVKTHNPCAQVIFYMTWGYKNGDAANCPFFTPLCTYNTMDSMLRLRYTIMAEANEALLCPAGAVWRMLRTVQPDINLYDADNMHPGAAGSYAAACSFYSLIFKKDLSAVTYNFSLPSVTAAKIRAAADSVTFDSLAYWTQHAPPLPAPTAAFTHILSESTVILSNTSEDAVTYLWDFGDGNTATAADPTHTYTTPGSYTIRLIAATDCGVVDTATQTVTIEPTGIGEQSLAAAEVSPVPAQDRLFIKHLSGPTDVLLLNTLGNIVRREQTAAGHNEAALDIAALPAGIYILQLTDINSGSRKALRIMHQ